MDWVQIYTVCIITSIILISVIGLGKKDHIEVSDLLGLLLGIVIASPPYLRLWEVI